MSKSDFQYSYGPVPSRRLGKSLGINNIPPKVCTYSCVYCQVGRTSRMSINRQEFFKPEDIFSSVSDLLEKAHQKAERVDYVTFVPDGEPTLDINLGQEISLLKALGVPIGVITNSSLIWLEDVRVELSRANWVSMKIDSVDETVWRKTDRPHRALSLSKILDGILDFSRHFKGKLVTETLLVRDLNDSEAQIESLADFIAMLPNVTAYLSIPTRPPAESWVQAPNEETLLRAYQILNSKVKDVEYLIGYEGDAFASTGNAEQDLMNITAVHPMRENAVSELLSKAKADWSVVDHLLERDFLVKKEYQGNTFYARKLNFKI